MKTPPRPRDEVRKAAFGPDPAKSDRPFAPDVTPAWAKTVRAGTVVSWTPGSANERPSMPAPDPIERPTPRTSGSKRPGGDDQGPRTLSARRPGGDDTAPRTASAKRPTPGDPGDAGRGASEPVIPPGMVLISQDELTRREAELTDALRAPYLEAAQRLMSVVGEIEQRVREDVVDMAARIAAVLMQRAVKLDRTITLDIARRALRRLGPIERVIVKCAESDADLLREHLPALARSEVGQMVEVVVRPSDDIRPGGVMLTFDGGVVDAREERRLARIVDAVKAAVLDNDAMIEGSANQVVSTATFDGRDAVKDDDDGSGA